MFKLKCSKAGSMKCCKICFHSKEHEKRNPKVGSYNNLSECDMVCGNDIEGYAKCIEVKKNIILV